MADVRRIGLDEVVRHFEELEDPRCSVNRKHPLVSVVVIALMAVLAGAGGPTAIARWAALETQNERDKGGGGRRGPAVGCGAVSHAVGGGEAWGRGGAVAVVAGPFGHGRESRCTCVSWLQAGQ